MDKQPCTRSQPFVRRTPVLAGAKLLSSADPPAAGEDQCAGLAAGVSPECPVACCYEFGVWSIALMAAVGAACGLAAFGLARGAEWGRRLAIGVLTVNLVGDTFNAVFRHDLRTLIGLPIGELTIWYLLRQRRH
jgi:hypothetical protein